jgi:hypothetical protein
VASGWDESDIKEGLNIFRAYKMSGGDADVVSDYKGKVVNSSDAIIINTGVDINSFNRPDKINKVTDYKIIGSTESENLAHAEYASKNVVSLLDTHIPSVNEENKIILEASKTLDNIHPMDAHMSPQSSIPVVTTPLNYIAHQSHLDQGELDAYNKNQGKPIFLVILDVVLFLVTLGLLIYILLS